MHHIRNITILTLILFSVTQVSAGLQHQESTLQQASNSYLPMVLKAKNTPTPTNTPTATSIPGGTGHAEQVLALVNTERAKIAGCPALKLNNQLIAAAQGHSQDMADNDFFSHTGSNGSTFGARISAAGYRFVSAGENIAAGQANAQEVFSDWFTSSGHRANMLNCNFVDMGLAAVEQSATGIIFWTQDFGKPRS